MSLRTSGVCKARNWPGEGYLGDVTRVWGGSRPVGAAAEGEVLSLAPGALLLSSHFHPNSQVKELVALGGEP